MTQTITVTQYQREIVRGLVQDSLITYTQLSAPDVYVAVITTKDTTNLINVGDSTVEPRLTRVRIHLFRKNEGNAPFSATVVIDDAPPPKNPRKPDHTLAVQFHLPDGSPLLAAPENARPAAKRRKPQNKRRS